MGQQVSRLLVGDPSKRSKIIEFSSWVPPIQERMFKQQPPCSKWVANPVAPARVHCNCGRMRNMRRPLLGLWFLALPLAYVPSWWAKGWPRGRAGSQAEAELLSQLAVLLMPQTDIGELLCGGARFGRVWGSQR